MRLSFLTLAMLTLLAFGLVAAPPEVRAVQNTDIETAPPEPIYEVDPGERDGYIRSPGYWRWNGDRHVWVAGRWIPERAGHIWVQDQWQQRGEKWHFITGHWVKDESYVADEEDKTAISKSKKKKIYKPRVKIDYNDTTQYPRYRR
jgi:hypothetical protein